MAIIDISQTIRKGIAVWPGDQPFSQHWTMRLRNGDSCNVSAVTMSTHTGTHLDAPCHFDDSASDIASVPLEHYVGRARVVTLAVREKIALAQLETLEWENVDRVLFRTEASDHPEDRFDKGFVYLSEEGAEFLGKQGLLLVGTDAPSIDAFNSKDLRAHKILLEHNTAILEGLRLAGVPPGDYELICLPLKLAGLDGSPVRAVLRTLDSAGAP